MPTNRPNSIVGDCLSGFATLLKLRGGGYSATLLKIKGQIDLPLVVRKLGTESAGSYLKQWPHKIDIRKTVRQVVIDYPILKRPASMSASKAAAYTQWRRRLDGARFPGEVSSQRIAVSFGARTDQRP